MPLWVIGVPLWIEFPDEEEEEGGDTPPPVFAGDIAFVTAAVVCPTIAPISSKNPVVITCLVNRMISYESSIFNFGRV